MVSDQTRSRGQLILIGALMLATVIFGLSMLLNSMLFTGATGDTGASAAVEETNFVDYDVELGARELVVRLNHAGRNRTATELGDALDNQMRNYSRALGEARARSGSVAVSVDYNNSTSSFGQRIVQDHNAPLTDAGSGGDWYPVPSTSPPTRVGWFSLSVDVKNTSSGFGIRASNDTGDWVKIDIDENGSKIDVTHDASFTTGSGVEEHCSAERGRVLLDVYAGRSFTDKCTFTGIGRLDSPSTVEFQNPDELEGKYAIVVNRTNSQVGSGPGDEYPRCVDATGDGRPPSDAEPCITPAIWTATITTDVVGDSVNYENTYNLTVYTNER